MDIGQVSMADLSTRLGERKAFVRAALDRTDDQWTLRTLEAFVGAEPPGWHSLQWEYPSRAFVATTSRAKSILGSLLPNEVGDLAIGPFAASVPAVYDTAQWHHRPSRAIYDPAPLPWPTVDFEINGPQASWPAGPSGFLVGDGCPSFTDADAALRALFYDDYSTIGGGRTSSRIALIRCIDDEAWIERVTIGPTHFDVALRGKSVAGVDVELTSGRLRLHKKAGPSGRVRVRLPDGLPEDAWLFVTRGSRWLDYRQLGQHLPGARDRAARGVELAIPDDPDSRVAALVAQGEGPRVEFKLELPQRDERSRRRVLKTAAAFANGSGGSIVFGIDPDEVTVVGISTVDEQAARDELGDVIRRIMRPTPDFDVRWASASGARVLVLEVAPGRSQPYGLQLQSDGHIEFYFRRGASTFPATQQEVREAALQTAPNATPTSDRRHSSRA